MAANVGKASPGEQQLNAPSSMLKAVLRSGRLPNAVSAGVLSFLGPLRMRNLNVANDKLK